MVAVIDEPQISQRHIMAIERGRGVGEHHFAAADGARGYRIDKMIVRKVQRIGEADERCGNEVKRREQGFAFHNYLNCTVRRIFWKSATILSSGLSEPTLRI